MKRLASSVALAAVGLFLGRGAQAETILDFDIRPLGQANNQLAQSFGDNAAASSEGVTVIGFGTPNIGLTWQATPAPGGAARWDYYLDGVWSAGQLDSSSVGDRHEIVFTPNSPQAAAVIKSFNFHPYYLNADERFTYEVSVLAGTTVVTGPSNLTFLADSTKNHPVSLNYTGSIGQALTLRIARMASVLSGTEAEGGGGNIAVDDITFAQLPETEFAIGPQVLAVTPGNNQVGVAPDYFYSATITNGLTAIVTGTVQLKFNGTAVSPPPNITQAGGLTTISYQSAALIPAGSTNRYTLTFSDNGAPAKNYTNEVQYVVAAYVNIQLPAPIVFEDFNSTPEGSLPAGWTAVNFTDASLSDPEIDFANLDSAAYTNWSVVDVSRFAGLFETYSSGFQDNADYQRVLSVNPSNVVNGVFQRQLATGRMAFGNSGYRNGLSQIVYLFSPDFNMTGKSDVYLSFHSLWEQNQDSIAAVEYSIDGGTNWLPIVYMLDGPDVFTNLDGSIDALTTLTNEYLGGFQGVATYVDPDTQITVGGFYGAFIGVTSNQWSTLAPYISRRVDDNAVESKRVGLFRLPQADNQAKVRLRFAHAGTDSWYFGVDNLGLYSLTPPSLVINSIVRNGSNVTISWNGTPGVRLQKSASLTTPNWGVVSGTDGASSYTDPASGPSVYYRLIQ